MDIRDAYVTICSECGARPGWPCRDEWLATSWPHVSRVADAFEIFESIAVGPSSSKRG